MKDFLDPRYLEALGADLIIEEKEDNRERTYVCFLDKSKSGEIDVEDQEVWRIKCVEKTGNITRIIWPNSSKAFEFSPNKRNEYNYKYSI